MHSVVKRALGISVALVVVVSVLYPFEKAQPSVAVFVILANELVSGASSPYVAKY